MQVEPHCILRILHWGMDTNHLDWLAESRRICGFKTWRAIELEIAVQLLGINDGDAIGGGESISHLVKGARVVSLVVRDNGAAMDHRSQLTFRPASRHRAVLENEVGGLDEKVFRRIALSHV